VQDTRLTALAAVSVTIMRNNEASGVVVTFAIEIN